MSNKDLTCGHFVNPFTDIGFKIIFGQPASKELLITLLNELLAGEHQIENLTFLDKENHSDNLDDAAQKVADLGIIPKAEVAKKAIPYCNITCIRGEEMKTALSGYLQVLYDQDPTSVGGALPGDDFYYIPQ